MSRTGKKNEFAAFRVILNIFPGIKRHKILLGRSFKNSRIIVESTFQHIDALIPLLVAAV